MKNKILKIIFLSICLLSIASLNNFAQDESAYQKSLSEAYVQSNPSEYRAQSLKKVLENRENLRMSENAFNQFVANKMKELSEIDFYAAFLAQSITTAEFIKWHEVFELLPAEQVAAIKK